MDRGTELVMTENLRLRIILVELTEQGKERTFLRPSTSVSGMALRIQTALVTDTDRPGYPEKYAKELIKQTGDKFLVPETK